MDDERVIENKLKKLSTKQFLLRLLRNFCYGLIIIFCSLCLGMVGYRHYENMSWVDAYANSAMILSGMGPLQELKTDGGKIFAGTFALFSGILFLVTIAVMFSPLIHRLFQKFHLE